MADNGGELQFANAVLGGTATERGVGLDASLARLGKGVTSIGTGGNVTWSGQNVYGSDTKTLAASITYTSNTTAATITGFSWSLVAGATYVFELNLPTTMTVNGGLTVSFLLTTATLTSIQYQSRATTAADNTTSVSTQGTTAASGTKIFDSKTAAYTLVNIKGSMVVNAAGTFAWQACQNTSAGGGDVSLILLGAFGELRRVL